MKQYFEEVKRFLKNKIFLFCMVTLAVIAFGYAAANTSISIDDLEIDRYVGAGQEMLKAGRFGIWFWAFIQGSWESDFTMDVLSVIMLTIAAINCCILFRRVTGNRIRDDALTVFACMLLTYPLVIEIWEYTGANMHIHGSMLLMSWSLLLLQKLLHSHGRRRLWKLLPVTAMLTLVCAGYESVAVVYVFLVFAILALQAVYGTEKEKTLKEMLRQGMVYALMLAAGLVMRIVIHRLTLAVTGLQAGTNGETTIYWLEGEPVTVALRMVAGVLHNYILNGIKYLPIGVLAVCGVIFVVIGILCCKKHGAVLLLPGLGMLLSLVIMSFVQGMASPYRTCQVFGVFCAFTAMLLIHLLPEAGDKKWLRTAAVVLLGALCLQQATFINYFLELNHRRSLQEAQVVRQISVDLQQDFDPAKPVIFVGSRGLDRDIEEAASTPEDSLSWKLYRQVATFGYRLLGWDPAQQDWERKLPQTCVNSVIDWSVFGFNQESMHKLFAYYGYEYVAADFLATYEPARLYAEQTRMPGYPNTGYIEDVGDYIIVNLQREQ